MAPKAAAAPGAPPPPGMDGAEGGRWDIMQHGDPEKLRPILDRCHANGVDVTISKSLSYILRHSAQLNNLDMRKDGYAKLTAIMKTKDFKGKHSVEEVMAVCYFDSKSRFSLIRESPTSDFLVRANQGHTMKNVTDEHLLEKLEDARDIAGEAIHGTYLVHWPFIRKQGLSKAARNHIHLAMGLPDEGKIQGMRSSAEVFIYVDVGKAMEDGIVFHQSSNHVLLTLGDNGWLAPKYFKKVERVEVDEINSSTPHTGTPLEFEKIDRPPWPSELAPCGPLGDTYTVKNVEALCLKQRKQLQLCMDAKRKADLGGTLTEEEENLGREYDAMKLEFASLEQRKKQQGGTRNRVLHASPTEDDMVGVTQRKDRDATPPWQRERRAQLEAQASRDGLHGITYKDGVQWSALREAKDKELVKKTNNPLGAAASTILNREASKDGDAAQPEWRRGRRVSTASSLRGGTNTDSEFGSPGGPRTPANVRNVNLAGGSSSAHAGNSGASQKVSGGGSSSGRSPLHKIGSAPHGMDLRKNVALLVPGTGGGSSSSSSFFEEPLFPPYGHASRNGTGSTAGAGGEQVKVLDYSSATLNDKGVPPANPHMLAANQSWFGGGGQAGAGSMGQTNTNAKNVSTMPNGVVAAAGYNLSQNGVVVQMPAHSVAMAGGHQLQAGGAAAANSNSAPAGGAGGMGYSNSINTNYTVASSSGMMTGSNFTATGSFGSQSPAQQTPGTRPSNNIPPLTSAQIAEKLAKNEIFTHQNHIGYRVTVDGSEFLKPLDDDELREYWRQKEANAASALQANALLNSQQQQVQQASNLATSFNSIQLAQQQLRGGAGQIGQLPGQMGVAGGPQQVGAQMQNNPFALTVGAGGDPASLQVQMLMQQQIAQVNQAANAMNAGALNPGGGGGTVDAQNSFRQQLLSQLGGGAAGSTAYPETYNFGAGNHYNQGYIERTHFDTGYGPGQQHPPGSKDSATAGQQRAVNANLQQQQQGQQHQRNLQPHNHDPFGGKQGQPSPGGKNNGSQSSHGATKGYNTASGSSYAGAPTHVVKGGGGGLTAGSGAQGAKGAASHQGHPTASQMVNQNGNYYQNAGGAGAQYKQQYGGSNSSSTYGGMNQYQTAGPGGGAGGDYQNNYGAAGGGGGKYGSHAGASGSQHHLVYPPSAKAVGYTSNSQQWASQPMGGGVQHTNAYYNQHQQHQGQSWNPNANQHHGANYAGGGKGNTAQHGGKHQGGDHHGGQYHGNQNWGGAGGGNNAGGMRRQERGDVDGGFEAIGKLRAAAEKTDESK
eukprot:g3395.t1